MCDHASVPIHLYGQLGLTTADIDGIHGVFKQSPGDFIVEEIPAYEPSGEGDHIFLKIKKQGLATRDVVQRIMNACALSDEQIGVAGLKDAQAVTTQYISIPRGCEAMVSAIECEQIAILDMKAHGNKLRTGHVQGNIFTLMIRDIPAEKQSAERLAKIVERIKSNGFLNFYDVQRFGHDGRSARDGLRLLTAGEGKGPFRGGWRKKLVLSAAQSYLFNLYLYERHQLYGRQLLLGDLVQKCDSGGVFWVDDLVEANERYARGELVITGPMYGKKMRDPLGDAGALEAQVLTKAGLKKEDFAAFGKLLLGTRRPNYAFAAKLSYEYESPTAVKLTFTLPAGCYATVLLAEIIKPMTSRAVLPTTFD